MKGIISTICFFLFACFFTRTSVQSGNKDLPKGLMQEFRHKHNIAKSTPSKAAPVISGLTYDSITHFSVIVFWATDSSSDSRIRWMVVDSNYQSNLFTDSLYNPAEVKDHEFHISNLSPARIYKYQVASVNSGGMAVDSGYFVTASLSSGNIRVYFNNSVDTSVALNENAPGNSIFENAYISYINSAVSSIDVTLWEFSYYDNIATALINAKNRGVKIRFIYTCAAYTPQVDSLISHGIPVIKRNFDTTYSMHNKFWIFDHRYNTNPANQYLLTGSTNISHAMFHSDKNNIIVIQDASLCGVYEFEFEEMWGSHGDLPDMSKVKFGKQKTNNTPHILNIAGTRMEVYFAPTDSVCSFMRKLMLKKTTKSILFCMYKFVLPEVESALKTLFESGKDIRGVFDSSNSEINGCAFPRMKGYAVPNAWNPPADVFVDPLPGLVHHKYFIIDADAAGSNKILSTGSYNWTVPAEQGNDENSLTIFSTRIANLYFQEFYKRFRESGGEVIIPDGINNFSSQEYKLYQNYPNPVTQTSRIKFCIPRKCKVSIQVYDILGHPVYTIADEALEPGTYERIFDRSSLNSGVYFYTMKTEHFSAAKLMMIR